MTAVLLQIQQTITRKEEASLLPPHLPVVWYNFLDFKDTQSGLWHASFEFVVNTNNIVESFYFSIVLFYFACFACLHCFLYCCYSPLIVWICIFVIIQTAQDVLIYLFGESVVHLSIEGLGSITVQELGRSVRETLHIPEAAQDAFAFWLVSPLLGKNVSLSINADLFIWWNDN